MGKSTFFKTKKRKAKHTRTVESRIKLNKEIRLSKAVKKKRKK